MRKRLPYHIGDWFVVPLENERYAVGLIARANMQGVAFGYFFILPNSQMPTIQDTEHLQSEDADLVCQFGDLHLLDKRWPILGKKMDLDSVLWAMPPFARELPVPAGVFLATEYDPETFQPLKEWRIDAEQAAKMPRDTLAGAGAVEIRLNEIIRHE